MDVALCLRARQDGLDVMRERPDMIP